MKTLLEILQLSTQFLQKKQIINARRQAEYVISDALNMSRLHLYLEHDRPLSEAELSLCRERISRRAQGEPTQYLKGDMEFLNCTIKVSPAALIPRQETEILVDIIIKRFATLNLTHKRFWDVCCGTGCIGIAIKKRFPELEVTLADISAEALELAKENAERNEVQVNFVQGNLLDPLQGQTCHFFVCNPPYISEEEFKSLEKEVRDYEPRLALVAGPTGLEFYQRLADGLPRVMVSRGMAWFKFGASQGEAIQALFSGALWRVSYLEQDWAGHDRFFFLEIE